jgi:hypothetical protein
MCCGVMRSQMDEQEELILAPRPSDFAEPPTESRAKDRRDVLGRGGGRPGREEVALEGSEELRLDPQYVYVPDTGCTALQSIYYTSSSVLQLSMLSCPVVWSDILTRQHLPISPYLHYIVCDE